MNPIANLLIAGLKTKMSILGAEASDRLLKDGVVEDRALRRGVRAGIELAFREHYLPAADMLPRNNLREEILKEVGIFFIEEAAKCFNGDCIVATRWLNKLADVDIAPKVIAQPQRNNQKQGKKGGQRNAPKAEKVTKVTPPALAVIGNAPETQLVS